MATIICRTLHRQMQQTDPVALWQNRRIRLPFAPPGCVVSWMTGGPYPEGTCDSHLRRAEATGAVAFTDTMALAVSLPSEMV